jgi:hypothetical protein
VPQTSLSGHTGAPSQATPQRGAELFESLVTDWTYLVRKALIEKAPITPKQDENVASATESTSLQELPPQIRELLSTPSESTLNTDEDVMLDSEPTSLFRSPVKHVRGE